MRPWSVEEQCLRSIERGLMAYTWDLLPHGPGRPLSARRRAVLMEELSRINATYQYLKVRFAQFADPVMADDPALGISA
jgi:hypothetical protein